MLNEFQDYMIQGFSTLTAKHFWVLILRVPF